MVDGAAGSADPYTGVTNLEAMEEAVNYQRFLTELIAELAEPAGAGCTLLDFGAGVGTYARQARSLGHPVLCVEADGDLRSHLAAQGFQTAELSALPSSGHRALYSFNVIEHIEDDEGILKELFRVTAPGGRLLLYVPAFPVLYNTMDRHVGHVRRYRKAQLIGKTSAAGFQVDSCFYADSLGFLVSLVYRFLPRATGVITGKSVRQYDRLIFPLSRRLDAVLHRWMGKNLVLTAHREPEHAID